MSVETRRLVLIVLLASEVLVSGAQAATRGEPIRLAITFDDLPWVGAPPAEGSAADAINRMAAVLNVHDVPATGFVICDNAARNEAPVQTWVSWGFSVGNHTAAHRDLDQVPIEEWLAGAGRCDKYLERYGDAYLPYLRFPLLHQGSSIEKRDAARAALSKLGLETAHVTVDTSDWILTKAHASAIRAGDAVLRREIGVTFIRHVLDAVEHADAVAKRKAGRAVSQVLLLHANSLVADYLDELLLTLRERNVEFVSLPEALKDPVYERPDTYAGGKGLSWLYRIEPRRNEDVAWDDAEAERIRTRFASALDISRGNAHDGFDKTDVTYAKFDPSVRETLEPVFRRAGESERLRSLLIAHRGKVVAEAYFNGAGPGQPANLKSITKTLTSALVGVALKNDWIESVNDPVAEYLPRIAERYPDKAGVTIRQLLTMSTGIEPVDYGVIQQSNDWIRMLLNAPLREGKTGVFVYDTPVLQILAALVETTGARGSEDIAAAKLLGPAGADIGYWRQDPQGIAFGGNDAYLLPRDMLRFGSLFLHGGISNGSPVLPRSFVEDATSVQIATGMDSINHGTFHVRGYGYLWWLIELDGNPVQAALGHGGQMILVSPMQDLVVVVTSRWPGPSSTAHYRHIAGILEKEIFPFFEPGMNASE